jgi:NAD dependent epimerase/dehydratase family enzyme
LKKPKLEGIFNASAPQPVTNEQWMTVLRKTMKVPFGLPMPTWMLQLGAIIMGTETELVLKSRWVLPERLLNEGYRFLYPSIAEATNQLIATSINKKDQYL